MDYEDEQGNAPDLSFMPETTCFQVTTVPS